MANILVIDDDVQVLYVIKKILGLLGHQVEAAVDGGKAIKILERGTFDLIITDLIMPNKEGLETIMEVRQKFPGCKIIAMSGGGKAGSGDYLDAAKNLGADRVLTKPFDVEELSNVVQDILK